MTINNDPDLLSQVMTYPRPDMTLEEKHEYVVIALMYATRLTVQLLTAICAESDPPADPVAVWQAYCALRG
jgi:hypothetical protein